MLITVAEGDYVTCKKKKDLFISQCLLHFKIIELCIFTIPFFVAHVNKYNMGFNVTVVRFGLAKLRVSPYQLNNYLSIQVFGSLPLYVPSPFP